MECYANLNFDVLIEITFLKAMFTFWQVCKIFVFPWHIVHSSHTWTVINKLSQKNVKLFYKSVRKEFYYCLDLDGLLHLPRLLDAGSKPTTVRNLTKRVPKCWYEMLIELCVIYKPKLCSKLKMYRLCYWAISGNWTIYIVLFERKTSEAWFNSRKKFKMNLWWHSS